MNRTTSKFKFLLQLAKVQNIMSRKFNGQGLGFGDLAVLYAISQAPDGKIRRVDLADAVGLTASGVTRILIPLEKIGVIRRETHERDARVSFAIMTRPGREMFENSLKSAEAKCEDLMPSEEAKVAEAAELLESMAK